MATDDVVWGIIGKGHCSHKLKTSKNQDFCRSEWNATGFCTKQSCPLANSRYATIRRDESTGNLYLYIKAVERAHLPSQWWEKIRLSRNYVKALEQVDSHLAYWPKFLLHKNKQRLTRLTQVNVRIKRLAKEEERLGERLVPRLASKVRRREEGRERKALAAAKIERQIERVLIDRLRSGAYGERPINVEPGVWEKVLKGLEKEGQVEQEDIDEELEEEYEGIEHEYEQELDGAGEVEYVDDLSDSGEELSDLEDWLEGQDDEDEDEEHNDMSGDASNGESEEESEDDDAETLKKTLAKLKRKRPTGPPSKSKKRSKDAKGPRVEIEYEREIERPRPEVLRA